jgi:pimeloyl-ACP methyl ester carboxylesterase
MSMFKPHLLLVHGNWGDTHIWDVLSPHLRAEGYRLTAVRMPMRGDPTVSKQGFDDYVKAVEWAALKIKRSEGVEPIIVGHSLGGTLALKAVEKGRGCGMILIAPSPPSNFSQPMFCWANVRLFGPWLLQSVRRRSFDRAYLPGETAMRTLFHGWSEDAFRAEYARMHPDSGRILGEFFRKAGSTQVELSRISVPTLCIAGTHDPVSHPVTVRSLAFACNAEYQEIKGSHFLLTEVAKAPLIAKTISMFLDTKSWDHLSPWQHMIEEQKGSA